VKFLFQHPCLVSHKTEQKKIIGKFDLLFGYGKTNERMVFLRLTFNVLKIILIYFNPRFSTTVIFGMN
jgi:hypothetical protein